MRGTTGEITRSGSERSPGGSGRVLPAADTGHIPGALNVPLGKLEQRLNDVRAVVNSRVAVVCRTDKRSAMAQATLRVAGFDGVVVLRGSMERWSGLGFDTVCDNAAGSAAIARDG